jgi:hypothetical protein
VRESAVLYFIIGSVFIGGVLAAYALLQKLPIIRFYERKKRERELDAEAIVCMESGEVRVLWMNSVA